ncbi:MAG TPA: hypothetical protein VGG10_17220 [Rhizomicrobium sp.]
MTQPTTQQTMRRLRLDRALIHDLVTVLSAHPAGVRRWTLMRSMRALAEKANREVTPKFEDDVERAFRRLCEGDSVYTALPEKPPALFFRPKDSVGEVWAVHSDKAQAFVEGRLLAA